MQDTINNTNQPEITKILDDHVFVQLNILSGKITKREIDEYNEALEEYEENLEQASRLGLEGNLRRPVEPKYKTGYKRMNFNLCDKVFSNWVEEWDEDNECQIVVVDCYSRVNSEFMQYHIKATETQWMNLLEQFGAVHTKLIPINASKNTNGQPE